MLRTIVLTVWMLAGASPASASALRIALTKATQPTSPIKYTVTTAASHGAVIVTLELPRKQAALDHLYRIDVVIRTKGKDIKTLVSAGLETKLDGGVLRAELIVDPSVLSDTELWIRTGEHAPLAETIYAIDVGSFR